MRTRPRDALLGQLSLQDPCKTVTLDEPERKERAGRGYALVWQLDLAARRHQFYDTGQQRRTGGHACTTSPVTLRHYHRHRARQRGTGCTYRERKLQRHSRATSGTAGSRRSATLEQLTNDPQP